MTGRWESACIGVLVSQASAQLVSDYAAVVAQRVADLRVLNPRDVVLKFITVTAGVATCRPGHGELDVRALLTAAEESLRQAKRAGRGRVSSHVLGELAVEAGTATVEVIQVPPGGETTAITPNAG